MIRNKELEKEMQAICDEIWPKIRNQGMPKIESKQGGSTARYYRKAHTIRFRSNVWDKLSLCAKRLLCIHELWHARGEGHKSDKLYLSSFDLVSLHLYERIYGKDTELAKFDLATDDYIDESLSKEEKKEYYAKLKKRWDESLGE